MFFKRDSISGRLSFKIKEVMKTFLEKQRLKEFITTRFALQEMSKGVLQGEMKEATQ